MCNTVLYTKLILTFSLNQFKIILPTRAPQASSKASLVLVYANLFPLGLWWKVSLFNSLLSLRPETKLHLYTCFTKHQGDSAIRIASQAVRYLVFNLLFQSIFLAFPDQYTTDYVVKHHSCLPWVTRNRYDHFPVLNIKVIYFTRQIYP